MYRTFSRVHFSRDERGDALLLAKDAIDQAIFERAAARFQLEVKEGPSSGEENVVAWYVDVPEKLRLVEFLRVLVADRMPCLLVEVPVGELAGWEDHALGRDFSFQPFDDEA